MKKKVHIVAAVTLAAALAGPTAASAFLARNNMLVNERADGGIYVPWRGKSGARYFWCAVGDYVVRGRGLPPTTRIWRVSSVPRHSGEGILFSLSAAQSGGKTGLVQIGGDDGSLSAAHARQLCDDNFLPFDN